MRIAEQISGSVNGIGSLLREVAALSSGSWRVWSSTLPSLVRRELLKSLKGSDQSVVERLGKSIGDLLLIYLEDLGPIYGKAAQMFLSRVDNGNSSWIDFLQLSRVYGQWPPVPQSEIWSVIDQQVPQLRSELQLEMEPLGVASIAQVYGAKDRNGQEWVVKVVKPAARKRLSETLAAAEAAMAAAENLPGVAKTTAMRELRELVTGLRGEINLRREADTIERLRQRLQGRRQSTLKIPKVWPELCSESVVVLERFRGVSLAKVVSGEQQVSAEDRRRLATRTLQELLVQVFEIGLFHADPHAGNLMLLDDGKIGIFDWGLAGELTEQDRKHIAEILKAVIARDIQRLAQALVDMATAGGIEVSRDEVLKELKKLAQAIQKERQDQSKKSLSLQQLISGSLRAAERLRIPIPNGLLMMSKALVTIEGLSKGIDPKVSLARIAVPVLFKAARPGMRDLFNMAKSAIALRQSSSKSK
jgi:ubiquinone biosynthesis protein